MSSLALRLAQIRCVRTTTIAGGHRTASNGRIPPSGLDQGSFEAAGIQPAVAASLRIAFPNVRKPTAMQRKLIRAMASNRDILLQDDTGTGKSFAAMLALLSKRPPIRKAHGTAKDKDGSGETPTGLLIVPHRDLAYQYLHWIHHMTLPNGDTPSSLAKYAQVLVRHANKSTLEGLPARMQEAIRSASSDEDVLIHKHPRILIATPSAALELIERQPEVFRLATSSAVVVDEVDALLRVPSSKMSIKRGRASREKHSHNHVPDLVRILDKIYTATRDKQPEDRSSAIRDGSLGQGMDRVPAYRPQLVMISATLRSRLQNALVSKFGWVRRGEVLKFIRKRTAAAPAHRLDRSAVHHVLVVSETGDIKNIFGARPLQPSTGGDGVLLRKDAADDGDDEDRFLYADDDDAELLDEVDKELVHGPLGFDPVALEAVASTFALDVARVALLVLPATAAVRKTVFELRQLGVNAHPLDLVGDEASRRHVLSREGEGLDEDPALIVATLATVRGIDIPDVTHVFMLGVPDGRSGDGYLHVAGRVGRFGGQGKVVTVVGAEGARRMGVVLSRLGVQPARLAHFG